MASGPSGDSVAIIVGAHPFPHGNASANRMLGLAQTFADAGLRSLVVNDDPRLTDDRMRQLGEVDVVSYLNLGARSGNRWQRWRRRRTLGARLSAAITSSQTSSTIAFVCVPSFFYTPATRRALRRSVPAASFIVDVVERHDSAQFPRGRLDPYFVRHRLTSRYARRTADRVIVISRALAEGPYLSRSPFVLPPTVATEDFRRSAESPRPESPAVVTYVGSPGAKDDLAQVVRAIGHLAPAERRDIRVVVGGLDRNGMSRLPGVSAEALADADDVLDVVGRLDRSGVVALLGRSHYTILIRDPEAGFARYGFPSKVPESMAAGCPPIANLTSDLADYLVDGDNALVCPSTSSEDIAATLRRALACVRTDEYVRQSEATVRTAEQRLSPTAWGPRMARWLADTPPSQGSKPGS